VRHHPRESSCPSFATTLPGNVARGRDNQPDVDSSFLPSELPLGPCNPSPPLKPPWLPGHTGYTGHTGHTKPRWQLATTSVVCQSSTSVSTPHSLYQFSVDLERNSVSRRLPFHPSLPSPTYANCQLAFSFLYLYAILPRHCRCRWCRSTLSQPTA
jgi:hypothetical protein